ncbi:MAG TPA: hypothetical protein VHY09_13230 [Candidatus Methylacidiphilales bacterium]|jgi:hypothetical protein|nr:hypothetical protein [Candidatus Methylacidiphilales bacterium]
MLVPALGLFLLGVPLNDSLKGDLNSPVYAVREKAREALHASFVPTDHTRWNGLRALLAGAKGKPAADVAAAAKEDFGVVINTLAEDWAYTSHCRLDADWVIECHFDGGVLVDARLLLQPPDINPAPPLGYTGLWRVYRQDGSVDSATYYMHGKPGGPLNDSAMTESP